MNYNNAINHMITTKEIIKEKDIAKLLSSKNLKISEDEYKYTYAIGDLHGCFYTFVSLLKKIPDEKHIILLGDILEKGENNIKTLKYIINLVKTNPYVHLIIGNHELRLMGHIINAIYKTDDNIDNLWFQKSYENDDVEILSYFKQHPNEIEDVVRFFFEYGSYYININDKFFITHGYGLPYYDQKDEDEVKRDIIRNRYFDMPLSNNVIEKNILNILGHIKGTFVKASENFIDIDTGAYTDNQLTAINLKMLKLVQVATDKRDILIYDENEKLKFEKLYFEK